jgi:hypothetical protein
MHSIGEDKERAYYRRTQYIHDNVTGKAIPVRGCEGPYSCETSRLPHFVDNRLTDGGKVELVSLMRRPPFTPQEDSWYSFLLEAKSSPGALVRLEGLGQLKKNPPHRDSNP